MHTVHLYVPGLSMLIPFWQQCYHQSIFSYIVLLQMVLQNIHETNTQIK